MGYVGFREGIHNSFGNKIPISWVIFFVTVITMVGKPPKYSRVVGPLP